ncbi:Protein of unknown function, partial [Gryllus bimaculatus]
PVECLVWCRAYEYGGVTIEADNVVHVADIMTVLQLILLAVAEPGELSERDVGPGGWIRHFGNKLFICSWPPDTLAVADKAASLRFLARRRRRPAAAIHRRSLTPLTALPPPPPPQPDEDLRRLRESTLRPSAWPDAGSAPQASG